MIYRLYEMYVVINKENRKDTPPTWIKPAIFIIAIYLNSRLDQSYYIVNKFTKQLRDKLKNDGNATIYIVINNSDPFMIAKNFLINYFK
jgi:hypothetical protein